MSVASLIWNVCDDELRGIFKPHEYGSVILPFVVLRRLDCVLEPHKDKIIEIYKKYKDKLEDPSAIIKHEVKLPFYNTSKYDLLGLKSDPQNVTINFNNYLNGYSQNVYDIIENFNLKKVIEKLNKENVLYSLIDKFIEVDLHPNKISNHEMGTIYEELNRRFSEMSNEESGDHYTPRDVVQLLVSLVFEGDKKDLQGKSKIRSIYDCCCGTGGMLTVGKKWILENINLDLKINLYGQELNDTTYAICKSDFLISGDDPENIKGPKSSLSKDEFEGKKFDYMIVNPPFGVSWKKEKDFIENEKLNPNGRFSIGTPRVSDGSLLFLQHLIKKMEKKGSKIGIIFNGSPLTTGDTGSGESEIRKWIIKQDLLETIICLPDRLFFNTPLRTFIWIVTNKKVKERKNKTQLMDCSSFYKKMRQSLGKKRNDIDQTNRDKILNLYRGFKDNKHSKIFDNDDFGHKKINLLHHLIVDGKKQFNKNKKPKHDPNKSDFERVPLNKDIEDHYNEEVKPFNPDTWFDLTSEKVGYDINFNKYFYEYLPLKPLTEIQKELDTIKKQLNKINDD